jgi:Holliday junction DNA helicase RuvB
MNWEDIVGQKSAKGKFEFYFETAKCGEPFPTLMLVGQKGNGKTELMKSAATKLKDLGNGEKKGMLVNAAAIKNLKSFWNSIVIPVLNDRDVTLCIDEASELPSDVTMALLTITEPNAENRTSFTYEDFPVDFDLKRQTFMFATTEPQKVFHALMNRCTRVDLEPYTYGDLIKILSKHCPNVTFEKGVLDEVAPMLRGNARITVLMARDIKRMIATTNRHHFTGKDWEKLKNTLDFLPNGISRTELAVLRVLGSRQDSSLTRIAATVGMTPDAVRKDAEHFLLAQGYMEIGTGGRNVTPKGKKFLDEVEKVA